MNVSYYVFVQTRKFFMKMLVGLGNPGNEYARTRHNAGFMVLDSLQRQLQLSPFLLKKDLFAEITKNETHLLVKPQTFMNESGKAVRAVLHFYKDQVPEPVDDSVCIIHDDLDIPFGEFKIQKGKSPKVHNGVSSVQAYLKTDTVWYVRVGIDGRAGDRSVPGKSYVLQHFSIEEEQELERLIVAEILPELMSRFT